MQPIKYKDIVNYHSMRLLLVEDDKMIGESICEALTSENYAVDWVKDGSSAELALANGVYDLLLLDLGLPKKQGLQLSLIHI